MVMTNARSSARRDGERKAKVDADRRNFKEFTTEARKDVREKKIVATYPGDRSEPERFRRLLGRVYGSPTPPPPPSKLTTDAVAEPTNLRGHLSGPVPSMEAPADRFRQRVTHVREACPTVRSAQRRGQGIDS